MRDAWHDSLIEKWSREMAGDAPPSPEALGWCKALDGDPQVVLDYAEALDRLDRARERLTTAETELALEHARAAALAQARREETRSRVAAVAKRRRGEIPSIGLDWGDKK